MSAMRKMGVYLGLLEDTEHQYRYDEYDTPEQEPEAQRQPAAAPAQGRAPAPEHAAAPTRQPAPRAAQVADLAERRRPTPTPAAPSVAELSRIVPVHPRTYNEARTIGENFRDGFPVIMNLSEMDDADAKRLVDFAAGLVFGVHGTIERITNKVFLLSPPNVSVAAEDKQRIAEGGFFNQS
ncbi:cell division protein SepF [Nocardioidaceae bacterium]|nr:cell division protein SepF [Nocardioidaceae bacterium]